LSILIIHGEEYKLEAPHYAVFSNVLLFKPSRARRLERIYGNGGEEGEVEEANPWRAFL
jgi:hypothetical protein